MYKLQLDNIKIYFDNFYNQINEDILNDYSSKVRDIRTKIENFIAGFKADLFKDKISPNLSYYSDLSTINISTKKMNGSFNIDDFETIIPTRITNILTSDEFTIKSEIGLLDL